jgi:hypothetical protein
MTPELKNQINAVAMTRALIDIPTSLLHNIKGNLTKLLTEEIEGVDELTIQVIRSTWAAEIENIELELIKRN